MPKVIKISDKVAKELDELRHTGQSYDGVLKELLQELVRVTIKHPANKGKK